VILERSVCCEAESAGRGDGSVNKWQSWASGNKEREQAMALSLRDSVHLVSDPRNLDTSVEEVFHLMLGVNCRRYSGPVEAGEPESVTAVVGFGGLLSGHEDSRTHDGHGV
jgi:hypothetical protein